jgi:single-stranded-DNA-specific exonuclease
MREIMKIGPFGNGNFLPIFLLKDLKIIKVSILSDRHISSILKPKIGSSIKSICFNCMNTKIAEHLLSYKKNINVIGQIHENVWNNKKNIQLIIKDILL